MSKWVAYVRCADFLFLQGNRVHKICREAIATLASPRHRARCSREARAGIVALIACCPVRLSTGDFGPLGEIVSLPACTQQSIYRGAAMASRLDPLAFSGDKRGPSKALLNGTSISDPEPVNFSCDPENWASRQSASVTTAKDIISARISFPARAAIVPLLDWLPERVTRDFCNPENSDALGDDSLFFAVTQQQWRTCVRRMLRRKLACTLPLSSLDPSLASGAFAVAKDEGGDRFIGDRLETGAR